MKAYVFLIITVAILAVLLAGVGDIYAESRTLTSRLVITVKAPDQPAPAGMAETYKVALADSTNRLIKLENPINTPNGLPRYTMMEML